MRGKYYLKHTINHMVDNDERIRQLNANYKAAVKEKAIKYLKNATNSTVSDKVEYLNSLTHDVFRFGKKYRYDCSLKYEDISQIIIEVKDDELCKAYYGKDIKSYISDHNRNMVILIVGIFALVFLLYACTS
jgi:uncharacterized membrane protein